MERSHSSWGLRVSQVLFGRVWLANEFTAAAKPGDPRNISAPYHRGDAVAAISSGPFVIIAFAKHQPSEWRRTEVPTSATVRSRIRVVARAGAWRCIPADGRRDREKRRTRPASRRERPADLLVDCRSRGAGRPRSLARAAQQPHLRGWRGTRCAM